MRLSFSTQFKIEFLQLFTRCRKVLGKMPGPGLFQHHHDEAVVKFDKIKNRLDSITSMIYQN